MIPYSKLNSHGNDFILVENDGTKPSLSIDQIKYYSKREVIGCDQFFIINTSNIENIVCDVFNQDGTKACQCGNGLRATMLYLNKKYNLKRARLIVCNQVYQAEYDNELISVNMGSPMYVDKIDRLNESKYSIEKDGLVVTLDELDSDLEFSFIPLSIGNDHCVVFSPESINYKERISEIINEIYNGIMNIGFIKNAADFMSDDKIILDIMVNERGAGYTDSCGSGATAAAICMFKLYELSHESRVTRSMIRVKQKGGILDIKKTYNPDEFMLIGPSSFDGEGALE
jgi:diaminopimelate epimerase|tara:strand:+ start:2775 stop:3632 length:858 start_codon:yes stop_codon:yes gene_type:complete